MSADQSPLSPNQIVGLRALVRRSTAEDCSVNRCRDPVAMVYLSWPLCWKHWLKHCAAEARAEEMPGETDAPQPIATSGETP